MLARLACGFIMGFALAACQPTKLNEPILITGGGPVTVLQSTYVSSGDSQAALGAGTVTYVVADVELLNDQALPLFPTIAHFSLIDRDGNRSFGIDTGSSAFAGISNDFRPLRPGEKRRFVVAFRAGATTMGTIRYDY